MNAELLQKKLPKLMTFEFVGADLVEVYKKPKSFIRDGQLYISAENGDDAADYYGEYRGGYPYINPALEDFATKNKGYFEWENPACIVFVKN
jgi:hypothetical protein